MIETRNTYIHGIEQIPLPYQRWVKQRNGKIGEYIHDILSNADNSTTSKRQVTVATRPLTFEEMAADNVDGDFYGTAVSDIGFVNKSILHPIPDGASNVPRFYLEAAGFAQTAHSIGLVIPGISIFDSSDLDHAYRKLREVYKVRGKRTDESDGKGQYLLRSKKSAKRFIFSINNELEKEGVVLEAQIKDPKTISVGFAVIGKDTYSFIAYQNDVRIKEYNETIRTSVKRNRYQGAEVLVVRGQMDKLLQLPNLDLRSEEAIETSSTFWENYKNAFNPDARRISFDYTYGEAMKKLGKRKEYIAGITDITARPGGTDPALLLAVKELQLDPSLTDVKAEVALDYDLTAQVPVQAVTFIDDEKLRVFASVTSKNGEFCLCTQ